MRKYLLAKGFLKLGDILMLHHLQNLHFPQNDLFVFLICVFFELFDCH
jgi:uncharacterized membrane protein